MSVRIDIQRSQFFSECDLLDRKKYFDTVKDKFVHNIDTLYYSVFLKDDCNNNEQLEGLFLELDDMKQILRDSKGRVQQEIYGLDIKMGSHAMVYNYRLQDPDKFDIFMADYLPNKSTPRIVVQLRSYGLWCFGCTEMVLESFLKVKQIFENYGIEIERTQENRIDYAYHTNSIQNPYKFFSDKNLDRYLYSTLTKYYKIGDVKRKSIQDFIKENRDIRGIDKFTLDYFALGKLKSNNVFERNYNKTREVVELGYKSFFFQRWFDEGLISFYDKYCLEFAYEKQNYNAVDEGRLRFYLKHGKDQRVKREIELELLNPDVRYSDLKKLADLIMPRVTIVMNIEFQTKRKFYYYADKQIDFLPVVTKNVDMPLKRLFRILDHRSMILDYLTSSVVAFIRNVEQHVFYEDGKRVVENIVYYQSWWKKLRSLKIKDSKQKYKRDYSSMIDTEKMFKRSIRSVATNAVYNGKKDTDFLEDLSDLLGNFNDNDMKDIVLLDRTTGQVMDDVYMSKYLTDYKEYKQKKHKAIKNRLCKTSPGSQNPDSNGSNN